MFGRLSSLHSSTERPIQNFLLLASVFFLFVGPILNLFSNIYLNSTHLYASLVYSFIFVAYLSKQSKVNHSFWILIFFWVILSSYFLFVALVGGDVTGITDIAFVLVSIISSYMLSICFEKSFGSQAPELFLKFCFFCALLWSSVILLSFFFPSFRAIMDHLFFRDFSRGDHLVLLRVPAFHPTGGDGASMNIALLIIIASGYLYYLVGVKRVLGIIILSLCMTSSLLSARTGFVIGAPLLFLSSLLSVGGAIVKKLLIILFVILITIIIYFNFSSSSEYYKRNAIDEYGYEHPISRSLITFDGFVSGGVGSTTAGTLFNEMIIVTDDQFRLVFGSGSFDRYVKYSSVESGSDVGYIRILNGLGVLGSTLLYSMFLMPILLLACRLKRESGTRMKNKLFILFCIVTIFIFIGNLKIIYLLTGYANLMFFSLFFVLSSFFSIRNGSRKVAFP